MHRNRKIKKRRLQQILLGVGLLVLCGFILHMASTGLTVEDRDATPVLFLGPLGIYLIFSKQIDK